MAAVRAQVVAAGAIVVLTVVLAAVALNVLPHSRAIEGLEVGQGTGRYSDDTLRLKRQQMVNELEGLRGLESGMRQQMSELDNQERALKDAWLSTEKATSAHKSGQASENGIESLSSSVFPAAFPGARAGLSVCEPWPSCCPSGNADNCFGVVSGGVLGAHACSPYPMCCGIDTHNCFDETSMKTTPDDSAAAPSQVDITHLAAICEGEVQLKQCLTQTQRCMTPNSEGATADTCTCFSSSLYCSYPQTPESCSPCPMSCQQKIYEWFKSTQAEDDGMQMQCPLFEKAQANEDISALDDGTFRPYSWFSDEELHPPAPPPKIIPAAKNPVVTPPIHVKWPGLERFDHPYKSAPDPYLPRHYRWYKAPSPSYEWRPLSKPAPAAPSYHPRRPHADRPSYYPPHQPTWSNYVNPKVAEREYVEAPYSYSFPHKSSIPPHMIDGYDMNKHVLDA